MVTESSENSGLMTNQPPTKSRDTSRSRSPESLALGQQQGEPTSETRNFRPFHPHSNSTHSASGAYVFMEGGQTNGHFNKSAKRIKEWVDRSPAKKIHTAPIRHTPKPLFGASNLSYTGAIGKPPQTSSSNHYKRQSEHTTPRRHSTSQPVTIANPALSTNPQNVPEDLDTARVINSSNPMIAKQHQSQLQAAAPFQGMTPSSSPPHQYHTSKIQPRFSAASTSTTSTTPAGPNPSSSSDVSNTSSQKPGQISTEAPPKVPDLIKRMIAYTRTQDGLKNARDNIRDSTQHQPPLNRLKPQVVPFRLAQPISNSNDMLAPSPILSDMGPSTTNDTRPRINMHTDLNPHKLNLGGRAGPIRKPTLRGNDSRFHPSNTINLANLPRQNIFGNMSASTEPINTRKNDKQQYPATRTDNTSLMDSPSTPVSAPYSTPLERPSTSTTRAHTRAPSLAPSLAQPGKEPSKMSYISKEVQQNPTMKDNTFTEIPMPSSSKSDPAKRISVKSDRCDPLSPHMHNSKPWSEHEWRQFSLAMRESMISHNMKSDELISLFRTIRTKLSPQMQNMPIGEIERRLTVWLSSTKKLHRH